MKKISVLGLIAIVFSVIVIIGCESDGGSGDSSYTCQTACDSFWKYNGNDNLFNSTTFDEKYKWDDACVGEDGYCLGIPIWSSELIECYSKASNLSEIIECTNLYSDD